MMSKSESQRQSAKAIQLDADNRCAHCSAPTIRGLNTDFCSLRCEEAFGAPPGPQRRDRVMRADFEHAHEEALLEDGRRRGRPELSIACPACHAAQGQRCTDYRGKRKQSCKERLLDETAQAARARYVAHADAVRPPAVQRTLKEASAACAAEAQAVIEKQAAEACPKCGNPSGEHCGTACPEESPIVECRVCGERHDGTCIDPRCWAALEQGQKERLVGRTRLARGFSPPRGWKDRTLRKVAQVDVRMAREAELDAADRAAGRPEPAPTKGAPLMKETVPIVCCQLAAITLMVGRPIEHVTGCGAAAAQLSLFA